MHACSTRFTTYERVEAARLVVLKRDGTRQEFDRDELTSGLRKALTRRPVADGAAEQAADEIEAELRSSGNSEIPSSRIGELAMEKLRAIDHIAYIRFASVYQSFPDLVDLKREVDRIYEERGAPDSGHARRTVSVLSDRDIRAELEAGRVRIDPYDARDLQPSSVDLHLDRDFRVFRNNRYAYIDVRDPQPDLTELLTSTTTSRSSSIPGEFVLGQTLEWVELPDDLVARLEGKALALDTPVPTPSGWRTMGDLEPSATSSSTRRAHRRRSSPRPPPMVGRPCREVMFSDGTRIVADASPPMGHDRQERSPARPAAVAVRTTDEIAGRFGHTATN